MSMFARSIVMLATAATAAAAQPNAGAKGDTIFLEIGARQVDGRIFKPHAALVRIYVGETQTAEWLNELTLGDSAGKRIMRWVTTSRPVASNPSRVLSVLRQTYDAVTLAPLGYSSTNTNGGVTSLAIDGKSVRGTKKPAKDATETAVDMPVARIGYFGGASDLVPVAAGLRVGTVMVAPVWSPTSSAPAEDRVFIVAKDTTVNVEGTPVRSVKVEERKRDGKLYANWYLLRETPYMVYGEMPLPDGRIQRMTEVPFDKR